METISKNVENLLKRYQEARTRGRVFEILNIDSETSINTINNEFIEYRVQIEKKIERKSINISLELLEKITDIYDLRYKPLEMQNEKGLFSEELIMHKINLEYQQGNLAIKYIKWIFNDLLKEHESEVGLSQLQIVELSNIKNNMQTNPRMYLKKLHSPERIELHLPMALHYFTHQEKYKNRFPLVIFECKDTLFELINTSSYTFDLLVWSGIVRCLNLNKQDKRKLIGLFTIRRTKKEKINNE